VISAIDAICVKGGKKYTSWCGAKELIPSIIFFTNCFPSSGVVFIFQFPAAIFFLIVNVKCSKYMIFWAAVPVYGPFHYWLRTAGSQLELGNQVKIIAVLRPGSTGTKHCN
jgi:hypothetical protein